MEAILFCIFILTTLFSAPWIAQHFENTHTDRSANNTP